MAEISDLNIVDDSNTARFPEGMLVSTTNNSARKLEGILARWFADTNGSVTPGGTADVITIAANQTITAYYDGLEIAFQAAGTNTGAVTINVDSLGAKALIKTDGSALSAGMIVSGAKVIAIYDGTSFQVVSHITDTAESNLAENWATKIDGNVDGSEYSSKAYAVGGTGVTNTAGKGAAKEWATKAEDSTVDGSGFSALHYSAKASASASAASTSASNAATSESNAATSETNAGASETNAAASAATALASTVGKYQSVIALTSVDSPYTLGAITENTLLNVTTTGGAVIINLPASAGLTDGILVGVNKIGATNTVTVNPNGSDTIGGAASFVQYDDTEWSDLYLNKAITDWQLGNLSFTSAGTGLEKTGSTIGIAAGGVDTTQLADDAVDPTKAIAGVNAQTGTTYTYALTDNLKTVAHSNGSAIAATIPTNASVAFTADETRIDIMNEGAGDLTVSGDTGVTVNGVSAGSFTITQYQGATIIKRGTDTWYAPNQTVA